MDYMEIINHPNFRVANKLIHEAEELLVNMGMTLKQAREWIHDWASGAGDGAE